jgi:hypothetical protein
MSQCGGAALSSSEYTALLRSKPLVCGGYFPVAGPQGATGATGATGPAGIVDASGTTIASTGKLLHVDSVYGNDLSGAVYPYSYPFLTISAAINTAQSGETVLVRPGTYSEQIYMKAGIALRGANTQTSIIQLSGVAADTRLLTMSSNCRVEDLTFNLTSGSNLSLTGVYYPSGSSTTSKLRTCVVNVLSTASGATVYGLHSPGTTATTYSSADTIRACTINVTVSGAGRKRGLYVDGGNWFSIRDGNINVSGSSSNIVGVETTNANAYVSLKHSTVRGGIGSVTSNLDINRTAGTILVGFTDLANNTANGNSFSTVVESATYIFGTTGGNLAATNYLYPGITAVNQLPVAAFEIPVTQNLIVFNTVVRFTGVIDPGEQVIFRLHKNGSATESLSVALLAGETTKSLSTFSVDFANLDTLHAEVLTVGNPGQGAFVATIATY